LSKFDTYCYQFHPNETSITKNLVCGWLSHEIKSGRHCIENKCAAIRSFANYVGNDSYKLDKRFVFSRRNFNPYILTDEELARLFAAIDTVKKPNDPFFAETAGVIFRLQYTCGLRPQEVRKIRCKDIDFHTGEIYIMHSKRNKDRIIVAAQDVIALLNEYRARRCYFTNDNNEFFIHTDGRPISSEQLTDLFQKCWKEANSNVSSDALPPLRPYDLRHRFASTLLQ
jgi:integrase